MKNFSSFLCTALVMLFNSCSNGQTGQFNLSATDFDGKIKELPAAPVLDVRTPDEFSKGHLQHAKNVDWNGNDFQKQISDLDKSKPVFVYCLSGGRSGKAAAQMRNDGFKEVYELSGGILKWRAANLPETMNNAAASAGMTKKQFDEMLSTDKLVLVDFYADWCEPCKRMKPYLDEISTGMKDRVQVIRINADDNQQLCKDLKIDALPVLQVYKNKLLSWNNSGYVGKEDVLGHLK